MSYADGLLATNERIMRRERQHWIFPLLIAGRWVAIAVVVFFVGLLLVQVIDPTGEGGIVDNTVGLVQTVVGFLTAIALIFAIVGLVWSTIQWRTQEYVLTDRRVMHVHGVINKQSSDASLENITDAQITVPWLGRIIGFGDLVFLTAAEAGLVDLRTLRDPIEFKKDLMDAKNDRLIEINTARMPMPPVRAEVAPSPVPIAEPAMAGAATAAQPVPSPAPAPAATSPASPVEPAPTPTPAPAPAPVASAEDVTRTLASLAELRDKGAITPEEYEAKKAELLGRI